MTTLPVAGFFTDPARINSEAKQGHDDDLAVIRELLGGEAESTLTIAAGSVTPDRAIHAIDTEAAASTDDLANIDQTNHPDGRLLMIRAANASRTVVVKHLAGGAGQVRLADAADFPFDDADKLLLLRRLGAQWGEVTRAFAADKAAARTFLGFTGAGGKVAAADLAADALKLNALPQAIFVADHTVVAGEVGVMLIANKATPITFPLTAAATMKNGWLVFLKNIGAGTLTIDPNGAETIDGNATMTLAQDEWTIIWTDGTNWRSLGAIASRFKGATVRTLADQSIPSNTTTVINWDAENIDTDTIHDNVTNNTRLTVPSGVTKIQLFGNILFAPNITGDRALQMEKNGAGPFTGGGTFKLLANGNGPFRGSAASAPVVVVGGDYFELLVFQNSGAALNLAAGLDTWFAMVIVE